MILSPLFRRLSRESSFYTSELLEFRDNIVCDMSILIKRNCGVLLTEQYRIRSWWYKNCKGKKKKSRELKTICNIIRTSGILYIIRWDYTDYFFFFSIIHNIQTTDKPRPNGFYTTYRYCQQWETRWQVIDFIMSFSGNKHSANAQTTYTKRQLTSQLNLKTWPTSKTRWTGTAHKELYTEDYSKSLRPSTLSWEKRAKPI